MNGIMRDMLSMCELDDPFQPSCAQILLFVDFKEHAQYRVDIDLN
jgi:hypothetical protein